MLGARLGGAAGQSPNPARCNTPGASCARIRRAVWRKLSKFGRGKSTRNARANVAARTQKAGGRKKPRCLLRASISDASCLLRPTINVETFAED